jgi:hypothetical protein
MEKKRTLERNRKGWPIEAAAVCPELELFGCSMKTVVVF